MEGIGLDNMLGAEEVEKLFADPTGNPPAEAGDEPGNNNPEDIENNEENNIAEVDFSDLLGGSPESVGDGNKDGNGGAPESNNGTGTPQTNLFSSITRILRDKGVFPDLSDEAVDAVQDEEALEKLFTDKVTGMFDARQQRLEKALNSGAPSNEVQVYEKALNYYDFLSDKKTADNLAAEGEDGEKLRKQVMFQDYINKGFTQDKAIQLIEQSIANGTEIKDAQESLKGCQKFYKQQIDNYESELESRQQQNKAQEEKQYASLKKNLLDTENFYGGVAVDKAIRQKAYDALTKPVYKDEEGNQFTAIQKYQKDKPLDFMLNFALMYALTDEFKSIEKLTKKQINAGVRKGFAELENLINNSKRNSDGSLDLANAAPDDTERENWTLA